MKYIRINDYTFPLLSYEGVWRMSYAPYTFDITPDVEIALIEALIEEATDDEKKAKIVSALSTVYPNVSSQNFIQYDSFREAFLRAHKMWIPEPTPAKPKAIWGLTIFLLGMMMFFYWDFMVCMGWANVSIPITSIVFLITGILLARKRLCDLTGDMSVDSEGAFDIWLIIYFCCVALGIADMCESAEWKGFNNWGYPSQTVGAIGGLLSIVCSAVFGFFTFIGLLGRLEELYQLLNAQFYSWWETKGHRKYGWILKKINHE